MTLTEEQRKWIEENQRLTHFMIKKTLSPTKVSRLIEDEEYDDLVQECYFYIHSGLLQYDENMGTKLSTYISNRIQYGIYGYFNRSDFENGVRIPAYLQTKVSAMRVMLTKGMAFEDALDAVGFNERERKLVLLFRSKNNLSLNNFVGDEEQSEYGEFLSDTDVTPYSLCTKETTDIMYRELTEAIDEILSSKHISPRDAYIWKLRFIDRRTLESIGQEVGVTRERVRQVEGKINARVQSELKRKGFGLEDYVSVS